MRASDTFSTAPMKAKAIRCVPIRKTKNPSIASENPLPWRCANNRRALLPANLSRLTQARPKQLLLPRSVLKIDQRNNQKYIYGKTGKEKNFNEKKRKKRTSNKSSTHFLFQSINMEEMRKQCQELILKINK